MNCEQVEKLSAELLDGTLDMERAREIENHLAGCSRCHAESESLADGKRLVSALPLVEPPAGFTARVMAQVHDGVRRPSIWQRLFLPLQIKIPLQATAVALIGIFSIYVYQKEQDHRWSMPSMPQDRLSMQQEKTRKTEPVAPAPPAIKKKQPSGAEFNAKGSRQEPTKAARSKNTSLQAPSEASRAAPGTSTPETPPWALEDKREQLDTAATNSQRTSEENTTPDGGAASAVAPALQSLRRERTGTAELSADRAPSSQDQSAPDYELVVRLRSPERREQSPAGPNDVLSKSAEKDKPLHGRTESIAGGTGPSPSTPLLIRTLWYSVPQNRYEEFKKNLATQGTIEFETAAPTREKEAARKPEDPLSIKVTIMPPR